MADDPDFQLTPVDFDPFDLSEQADLTHTLGEGLVLPWTVTSRWFGQPRQRSRERPFNSAPGSALMKSFGICEHIYIADCAVEHPDPLPRVSVVNTNRRIRRNTHRTGFASFGYREGR